MGDRYRIDGPAGEKKSCVVFRATRLADSGPAALRVLAPFVRRQTHVVTRLRSRAEFALAMEHPNLVPVLDVGEQDDAFIVVEGWAEAVPLLRLVRGKGACNPYETAWIAAQLSRGVDHLIQSGAPGFDFTLSDVYVDIGDLRREAEFLSGPVHRWPDAVVRLSPLALDGDGFSERSLATPTDSVQPLIRSVARIVFNLVTGGMGDPLSEPVLSEQFTASLRNCLTGATQSATCRELLWTLFGDFGPEVTSLLPEESGAAGVEGEVGSILEDLDRQGEELEALLRYRTFGKQIKRQLAVLEEQRAGVMEQQRRLHDDGERLQALEERLATERRQLEGQREELSQRGEELAEKEREADEAARERAAELRERETELATLQAEQERERDRVREELERLRLGQEGLASEREALSARISRYEDEQHDLTANRSLLEAERRKLDAEREEIDVRASEFKRLKGEIEQGRLELEDKQVALARRQAEMDTKGAGISEVERELRGRLAEEQKELQAKIEAMREKTRSLDQREEALRAKESTLDSASRALSEEEQTLAGRMGEVDSKLAAEKRRLADKEREIGSRESALAEKERELQARLERQQSVQEEKEALVEDLRGKLAGMQAELGAMTEEKRRLEEEHARLSDSQQALGVRSDSLDRERLDLKAFEEKLRKELQEESDSRSRENRALEKRIVFYRRFVRFGVPVAAAVILGLGALVMAKPVFPDNATAIRGLPEWKQEWLRRDLVEDIQTEVAAGQWREALGSLHYYSLGFSRRPDEVMEAARRTSASLAAEFESDPQGFVTTYKDAEGGEAPLAPALEELSGWGIPDAERLFHHLKARESLRQAEEERSFRARADALRSIVQLRDFYPDDNSWAAAVNPVMIPLISSSIREAVTLLEPGNSGRELSRHFHEVFSEKQVVRDLETLEKAGLREAGALLVAQQALGALTASGTPDAPALAIFIADRLAEGWPVAIRQQLIAVLLAHIERFRGRLRQGDGDFVEVLESVEKPPEVVKVASHLWELMQRDYVPEWFSPGQKRELYGFLGDALTTHRGEGANVHLAYQLAANEGDEEGMYWSGRGLVGAALEASPGGDGPAKRVANREAFDQGVFLLGEAAKSSDPAIRQEALWVLADTMLDLGNAAESVRRSRQAFEARPGAKAAILYFHGLLAAYEAAPDPGLADEISALSLEVARMFGKKSKDPEAEDVFDLMFVALDAVIGSGVQLGEQVIDELRTQFEIHPAEESFAGLRFAKRANWKYHGYPPFQGLSEDERKRQFLEDLWESARVGYGPARTAAERNGLEWQKDKRTAVGEVLGE